MFSFCHWLDKLSIAVIKYCVQVFCFNFYQFVVDVMSLDELCLVYSQRLQVNLLRIWQKWLKKMAEFCRSWVISQASTTVHLLVVLQDTNHIKRLGSVLFFKYRNRDLLAVDSHLNILPCQLFCWIRNCIFS